MSIKGGHYWLLLVAMLFGLSSCAAKKGYPGPERDTSELSYLYFRGDQGASIASITVNGEGLSVFTAGIYILPGLQEIALSVDIPVEQCWSAESATCSVITRRFECTGSFESLPAEEYRATVRGIAESASLQFLKDDDLYFLGGGSCTRSRSFFTY